MTQYCSPLQVCDYLNITKKIPEFVSGESPELETVGVGDASTDVFYLDHNNVISGTYTISYGSSEQSVTALTETTHYTLNLEEGKLTLTASGLSTVSTNEIYAEYKYTDEVKDSLVSDLIDRNTDKIDALTNRSWQSPSLVTQEEHEGRGAYRRLYRPKNLPLYLVTTTLSSGITSSATTLVLTSTTGLSASDIITVGSEQMSIDSVDSSTNLTVTRGANSSTAAAHSSGDWCVNAAVEISNESVGTVPSYETLSFRDEWDIDSTTGLIQLLHYNPEASDHITLTDFPTNNTFGRLRLTYKYGEDLNGTVITDTEITQLCIYMTAQDLVNTSIARALMKGIDGFTPQTADHLRTDIDRIIKQKRLLLGDYV